MSNDKNKRKYYRYCGICGCKKEQSFMNRVDKNYSPNEWICDSCYYVLNAYYILLCEATENDF